MSVAGIILAAGAGRRFGATKQLAELDGAPLLAHCVQTMADVPAVDPLIVVLGANAAQIAAQVSFGRARPIVCAGWQEGMSESLRVGIEAVQDCGWALIALGDQPRLTPGAIAAVIKATETARTDELAVRASYGGVPDHPVALSRALFAKVGRLHGDQGARGLLSSVNVKLVELDARARPCDIDTDDDLQRLRRATERSEHQGPAA